MMNKRIHKNSKYHKILIIWEKELKTPEKTIAKISEFNIKEKLNGH